MLQLASMVLLCILVLLPPRIIADSSYLSFHEDSLSADEYPLWMKRLHNLRTKAVSITNNNNLEFTNSILNGVDSEYGQIFEEFISLFGRSYHDDAVEHGKRFQIFMVKREKTFFILFFSLNFSYFVFPLMCFLV